MVGTIGVKSDSRECDSELVHIILREIGSSGGISFARFMELALYHPQRGYYASGRARIGRGGDFFTNVSVGPMFGKLLALQFAEVWERLERPRQFTIVEQGAHDGQFAADVLGALSESACFNSLSYVIVEPFPVWRDRQRDKLANFAGRISWGESVDEIDVFTGIHFSNELFDALPVHLVARDEGEWKELFVVLNGGELQLEERRCSGGLRPPIATVTSTPLSAGSDRCYSTEVQLVGPKLIRDIAAKLSRGVIITVDYGFCRDEFYSAERATGTLQVRAQHKKLSSPFERISCADISAHVDWTSLIEAAEMAGARQLGLADQHHFLTGILEGLMVPAALMKLSQADRRALQTLLHPEMLGRNFQVLALARNFTGPLSGFSFARGAGIDHGGTAAAST